MKTPFGCVAVATIGGRRVLPDHEFRRYESGALKVWMLDPEDPEKTSLLATCGYEVNQRDHSRCWHVRYGL
jgi:hypothetical protein